MLADAPADGGQAVAADVRLAVNEDVGIGPEAAQRGEDAADRGVADAGVDLTVAVRSRPAFTVEQVGLGIEPPLAVEALQDVFVPAADVPAALEYDRLIAVFRQAQRRKHARGTEADDHRRVLQRCGSRLDGIDRRGLDQFNVSAMKPVPAALLNRGAAFQAQFHAEHETDLAVSASIKRAPDHGVGANGVAGNLQAPRNTFEQRLFRLVQAQRNVAYHERHVWYCTDRRGLGPQVDRTRRSDYIARAHAVTQGDHVEPRLLVAQGRAKVGIAL